MTTKILLGEEATEVRGLNEALQEATLKMPEGMVPDTLKLIPNFRRSEDYEFEIRWALLAIFRPIEARYEDRCHMQLFHLGGGRSKAFDPALSWTRNVVHTITSVGSFHARAVEILTTRREE